MAPIERMSVSISLSRDCGGDGTVICIGGEHDLSTVPLVWASLALAMSRDDDLVIDLSAVRFMDASTVGVLMRARGLLRPRELRLRAPSRQALLVLTICELGDLVDPVRPEVASAGGSALGSWVEVPPSDRVARVAAPDRAVEPEPVSRTDRSGS